MFLYKYEPLSSMISAWKRSSSKSFRISKGTISYPSRYEIKKSRNDFFTKRIRFIPNGVVHKRIHFIPTGVVHKKVSKGLFSQKDRFERNSLSNVFAGNDIFLRYFQAFPMSFRSCSGWVWPFLQRILLSSWLFPAGYGAVPLEFLWQEACGIFRFWYGDFPAGILLPPSVVFSAGSARFCCRKLRDWFG